MDNQYPFSISEEERARRRAQRIAARRQRQRERRRRLLLRAVPAAALLCVAVGLLAFSTGGHAEDTGSGKAIRPVQVRHETGNMAQAAAVSLMTKAAPAISYAAVATEDTAQVGEELASQYAVVVDLGEGTILAQKNADAVISPASMTKILTVLVAAEEVANHGSLDDTVVIDFDITNYCYLNECSVAGFLKDEAVTVRDLFYGAILPSGADACLGLAKYVAGSQEDFVVLMNEKVEELGLSGTAHFANCIGLYDDANTCTVYDMAMILKAALDNELCRQVLTTKVYEIPASEAHPEGMVLSNWFLRKIEDHVPEGLEVLGAKTGFVDESGSCAASYAQLSGGGEYICVTGNAFSSWRCIKDHVQLYTTYLPGLEPVLE